MKGKDELEQEIIWLRSCFKSYDVDREGLEKIAKVIIKLKKQADKAEEKG